MDLTYKIISSPGETDIQIRDFIAANDHDFYPTIASRRDLAEFVQLVYVYKGKYVVCYDGETIVGLSGIYLDHVSFITYYLYVAIDKNYRGRGISTTLFNYLHEICRELRVQWAIVKTWSTNMVSQSMFKKHGFFHLYTTEDDRSKGVHTFFYAKSFADEWFDMPIKRIAIIGDDNNYALANFVHTISSIPKTNSETNSLLPYVVVSNKDKDIYSHMCRNDVSHIFALDIDSDLSRDVTDAEIIDLAGITQRLVNERKKKWVLIADEVSGVASRLGIENLVRPGDQQRVDEIIGEIRTGKVSPAYYKKEIADIARVSGGTGILLGTPELHTMFAFDKMFEGMEIFDPWLEVAIIIQNNRNPRSLKGSS